MPEQEQIDQQMALLETHRRTLQFVLLEQAKFGAGYVPPQLRHSIFEARAAIRGCKAALRDWGVAVEDQPDDEPFQAAPPASMSEQAGVGIAALADLLSAPGIRSTVESFRESFEIVCRQIDRLSGYKDLHDLLHDLQFNCYNPIVRGARDFPNNALFVESLADYEAELQKIANGLWEVAERTTLEANEHSWIQQIGQAADVLRAAIDRPDKQSLDRATFQIGRVLYIHPSRINERLKEAAHDLPLPSLIDAMVTVRQRPARDDLAPDKLDQVGRGIAALEQIGLGLARLIDEHDTWQEIDLELHRIEESLGSHVQELEWLWPDLCARIAQLCEGRSDRWSQDLRQVSEKFEHALAAQDLVAITAAFRSLRRQVGLCFFQADKKLKELCRSLWRFNGPLNSVMSIIHE